MDFRGSGLKMGAENYIFWSEIGSRFGEPGRTPPPRIPRSAPFSGGGGGYWTRLFLIDSTLEFVPSIFFSLYDYKANTSLKQTAFVNPTCLA